MCSAACSGGIATQRWGAGSVRLQMKSSRTATVPVVTAMATARSHAGGASCSPFWSSASSSSRSPLSRMPCDADAEQPAGLLPSSTWKGSCVSWTFPPVILAGPCCLRVWLGAKRWARPRTRNACIFDPRRCRPLQVRCQTSVPHADQGRGSCARALRVYLALQDAVRIVSWQVYVQQSNVV